jgi:hypothetical protein
MTEAEWLSCPYPSRLIAGKRGWQRSTRKLRLLTCACYRRIWHLLTAASRNAVETAERHADGAATNAELQAVQPAHVQGGSIPDNGVHFLAAPSRLFRSWVDSALSYAAWAVERSGPNFDAERRIQCDLIRDLFGPARFRAIVIDPAWLTSGVVGLARSMYESREFAAIPVLADALEGAGCDTCDVLDHCRGPGPHARGCWLVDLLLGKE